jgi:hypothetical protein
VTPPHIMPFFEESLTIGTGRLPPRDTLPHKLVA